MKCHAPEERQCRGDPGVFCRCAWGKGIGDAMRRAYKKKMGEDAADMYHAHLNKMIDNMMLSNAGVAHSAASHDTGEQDVRKIL